MDWIECFQNKNNTFYQGGANTSTQDFLRFYILFTFLLYWIIHFYKLLFGAATRSLVFVTQISLCISFVSGKYLSFLIGDSNYFWDLTNKTSPGPPQRPGDPPHHRPDLPPRMVASEQDQSGGNINYYLLKKQNKTNKYCRWLPAPAAPDPTHIIFSHASRS